MLYSQIILIDFCIQPKLRSFNLKIKELYNFVQHNTYLITYFYYSNSNFYLWCFSKICKSTGGSCETLVDGYCMATIVCFIAGFIWFYVFKNFLENYQTQDRSYWLVNVKRSACTEKVKELSILSSSWLCKTYNIVKNCYLFVTFNYIFK